MRMTTITKCKNADAYKVKIDDLDYNFFISEDFILRLIRAYKILNKDPSKTVIITSNDYDDYVNSYLLSKSIINPEYY